MSGLSIFTVPEGFSTSNRFRDRFNAVAKDMKIGLRWNEDLKEIYKVNVDELEVLADFQQKYGLKGNHPTQWNDALIKDTLAVLNEMERIRLSAVEKSALLHNRIPFRGNLESLTPAERKAVELFHDKVKPVLDRIEARQHDLNADILAQWMKKNGGDYYSHILFERFRKDNCAGYYGALVGEPTCSLFPFYPDQPMINGMIDAGITLEDFTKMGQSWSPTAEEGRPTTVLEKDGDKVKAIPLPLHPRFKADHQELAKSLDEIAALDIDPMLKDQMKKWAKFFRTGSAKDEALAVQATIDAGESKSNLRVHIGPSESYWDDNTKFPYLLQVGLKDPELSKKLEAGSKNFQVMETSLNDIPYYQARALSSRGGFADPIYQVVTGGFIESFPIREPLGNNFTNYSGYAEFGVQGSNRFILMDGLLSAADQIKVAMTRVMDDEGLAGWDARHYIIENVVGHESGHLLGPQRDHVTPNGQKMGAIFGAHWGRADEPKADLTALQQTRVEYEENRISWAETVSRLRGMVGMSFSNRYKGKAAFAAGVSDPKKLLPAHYYGHMMEVGYYFKTGAFSLTTNQEGQKRIHVDYDKILKSSKELWRTIIAFQAAGDVKGFLEFGNSLPTYIPDAADKLIIDANKDLPMFFIERHL